LFFSAQYKKTAFFLLTFCRLYPTLKISVRDIRKTDPYKKWVKKLRDSRAKARIFARIERLAEGNPGDVNQKLHP
jgi:hypothetical protein